MSIPTWAVTALTVGLSGALVTVSLGLYRWWLDHQPVDLARRRRDALAESAILTLVVVGVAVLGSYLPAPLRAGCAVAVFVYAWVQTTAPADEEDGFLRPALAWAVLCGLLLSVIVPGFIISEPAHDAAVLHQPIDSRAMPKTVADFFTKGPARSSLVPSPELAIDHISHPSGTALVSMTIGLGLIFRKTNLRSIQ